MSTVTASSHAPLKDTQNETDSRGVYIDRVGVKNLRYPLKVKEKNGGFQSTIANVALTVDLPHEFKGTHMSRFVEVLGAHGSMLETDSLKNIVVALRERLHAQTAHIDFEFPFFIVKNAPVTGAPGVMDYNVRFTANGTAERYDLVMTVKANVTTLCPCSKAISVHGAHNQRGEVTLAIRTEGYIWIEDLVRIIESSASSELYSLLKRPDEKAVTERAYENPVFVEDLVRNIAVKIADIPEITWYQIEAENFESIHNHNAYALVHKH